MDEQTANNFTKYVQNGGVLYSTYFLGMVNENDLSYLGGFPCGNLKEVFGIWNEELDSLYPCNKRTVNVFGQEYEIASYAEHIHAQGATVLGTYANGIFEGTPCYTVNSYGKGKAYYQAFSDINFKEKAFDKICAELSIRSVLPCMKDLPYGVTAHARTDGENTYLFVENYTDKEVCVTLENECMNMESGEIEKNATLSAYDVRIYKKQNGRTTV